MNEPDLLQRIDEICRELSCLYTNIELNRIGGVEHATIFVRGIGKPIAGQEQHIQQRLAALLNPIQVLVVFLPSKRREPLILGWPE